MNRYNPLRYLIDAITAPILSRLDKLEKAMHEEFAKVISDINDETNSIAARIDALTAQISSDGGLTPDQATSALSQLSAISDRLKALASDPNNPVPPAPPSPPTA